MNHRAKIRITLPSIMFLFFRLYACSQGQAKVAVDLFPSQALYFPPSLGSPQHEQSRQADCGQYGETGWGKLITWLRPTRHSRFILVSNVQHSAAETREDPVLRNSSPAPRWPKTADVSLGPRASPPTVSCYKDREIKIIIIASLNV